MTDEAGPETMSPSESETDLGLSDELQGLIDSGKNERPRKEQVAALALILGVPPTPGGGTGGGAGPQATGSAVGGQGASVAVKIIGGLCAAAVIAGGGYLLWPAPPQPAPSQTAAVVEVERAPVLEIAPSSSEGAATPADVEPVSATEATDERALEASGASVPGDRPEQERANRPRANQGAPVSPAPEIDPLDDIRLLQQARTSIASDPAGALVLLRRHRSLFPRSTLAQEREVLEIDALWRLGRRSAANARAASFRTRWPRSSHLRRVNRIVGAPSGEEAGDESRSGDEIARDD